MTFTKLDKAIMIGLTLGDGYINPNGRIEISHCKEQKEYCIFKAKLLHSVLGGKDIKVEEIERNFTQKQNGIITKTFKNIIYRFRKQCKHFKYFRELLYSNEKKQITKEILEMMNPLSIALWFLDDGSLVQKQQKNKTFGSYTLMLYTFLSKKQNEIIQQYFLDKYNMKWNVVPANIHKNDQYMLRCGQTEGRKFLNIIRDIVIKNVPSMSYKVLDI